VPNNKHPIVFTLIIGLLLGLSVFAFSQPISKKWLENQGIYFFSLENGLDVVLLEEESAGIDTAESVQRGYSSTNESVNEIVTLEPNAVLKRPSLIPLGDSAKIVYDSLNAALKYLYFSLESDVLESFFVRLNAAAKQSVRIWYYGDSQVEGDRITKELRAELQQNFGGYGLGYVPISNPASYTQLELGSQSDWNKYNCFQHRKKTTHFGPSGLVFVPKDNNAKKWNAIRFKVLKSLKYRQLSLQCATDSGYTIEWRKSKDSFWKSANRVFRQGSVNAYQIGDSALYGNIELRCKGNGLKVFGLNFEGPSKGVYLDNFGIRGHSGDGLRAISSSVLQQTAKAQGTGLAIFHFGNNMIPYLKSDPKSEKWVKDIFRTLFKKYRSCCPNMSFLVIGPGDMGYQRGENLACYASCPILNRWLREVAMEQGMAYFDFYQMIKDKGGILSWRSSHIASLDGHLGPRGQKIFARELSKELLHAYEAFRLRTGE
jgi:hypothetical protein